MAGRWRHGHEWKSIGQPISFQDRMMVTVELEYGLPVAGREKQKMDSDGKISKDT